MHFFSTACTTQAVTSLVANDITFKQWSWDGQVIGVTEHFSE